MSSSIWNLTHPLRTGHIPLKAGGGELFGTVIRHGKMKKTVTVSQETFLKHRSIGIGLSLSFQ